MHGVAHRHILSASTDCKLSETPNNSKSCCITESRITYGNILRLVIILIPENPVKFLSKR